MNCLGATVQQSPHVMASCHGGWTHRNQIYQITPLFNQAVCLGLVVWLLPCSVEGNVRPDAELRYTRAQNATKD